MTGRAPRPLAILVVLGLTLAGGACGDDDDAGDSAEATTTTTAAENEDGGGTTTSTTAASGDVTTTTAAGGKETSSPPVAGGDDPCDVVIELTITGGNVAGGVRRETVKQGSQVTLRVTSDVADELHVHTYDLKIDLVPGQSADLTFLAKVPGVFEVELEGRDKKVLELEVRP